MWEKVLWLVAGALIASAVMLLKERLGRRLDRRAQEKEEKIPEAQRWILEILRQHEDDKAGVYLLKSELGPKASFSDEEVKLAILELEERDDMEVLHTSSGDHYRITRKGLLTLAKATGQHRN